MSSNISNHWEEFNQLEKFLFFLIPDGKATFLDNHPATNMVSFTNSTLIFDFFREDNTDTCFFEIYYVKEQEELKNTSVSLLLDLKLSDIKNFLSFYIAPENRAEHFLLKNVQRTYIPSQIEKQIQNISEEFSNFEHPYFFKHLIQTQKSLLEYDLSLQQPVNIKPNLQKNIIRYKL